MGRRGEMGRDGSGCGCGVVMLIGCVFFPFSFFS